MSEESPSSKIVDQAVLHFTLGEEQKAEDLLLNHLEAFDQDLDAWRALSEEFVLPKKISREPRKLAAKP